MMARPPSGRGRLLPLFLVFGAVVISFTDRANLGLAMPLLSGHLHLSLVQQGNVMSAFGIAYVAGQLPGGWIVDRCDARALYGALLGVWSLFTGAMGFARNLGQLFLLRLGVGALESPGFPLNNKVITSWFPERERARATGFYTSGQFVGTAFISPFLGWLMVRFGWRSAFYLTGSVGLLWGIIWYLAYRDPEGDPGGLQARARAPITLPALKTILASRNMWGVFIGHLCGTVTLWFLLTWLPNYLVKFRHMNVQEMSFWVMAPALAAFGGALLSGAFSDWLLQRGVSLTAARKAPVVIGAVLSMTIVGSNFAVHPATVMLFLTLAGFGHGFSSLGWTFVSALAPAGLVGVTGGIYNFVGNLSAIFVPAVIGHLVQGGNFEPALIFVCSCAAIGALSFGLVVRDVQQLTVAGH